MRFIVTMVQLLLKVPDLKIEVLGTIIFAFAVLHTFLTAPFLRYSHYFPEESFRRGFFHLLGEVEVVFGFWAGLFFILFAFLEGPPAVISYQESLDFTEPLFVFVIMVIASTKPVLYFARIFIQKLSSAIQSLAKTSSHRTDFFVILTLGPLLGSLITEPAAMTVTALLIRQLSKEVPKRLAYFLLAVLFVNISIGGALTPFAAPPILMVAKTWSWDFTYVFLNFGIPSLLAVSINSFLFVIYFRNELSTSFYGLKDLTAKQNRTSLMPSWLIALHLVFLALVVLAAHYQNVFMGIFLFFLGITVATKKHQEPLRIHQSLLVSFFLGGIIFFGAFQKWWLQPLLETLGETSLFFGSVALTAVTDNAALTYLGSQVQNISEVSKVALVAGAISGGGLTVIANAPNAAGYSILADLFPEKIVSPMGLLLAAIVPTAVAIVCFVI